MTLGQIKSEIRRLQRKLARPLAQVAIQRMSQEPMSGPPPCR